MRVLMLLPVMLRGYGLPEVVAALCHQLTARGVECHVAAMEVDGTFHELNLHRVSADPSDVQTLADGIGAHVVIAHGSPFFEVLPMLKRVKTIAYEHGEPPAQWFDDHEQRRQRALHKVRHVYDRVDCIVTISAFVRDEIGRPDAHVILNGCDHIEDMGAKPLLPPRGGRPLRVGVLMRLGPGEARYKGNDLLPLLRDRAEGLGVKASWEVMGRGTSEDRAVLEAQGFKVHLNATNNQRQEYLRGLDVFVTLSKWEGCNLPLLEAQSLGSPGLALDAGAHPEYTPLLFSSVDAMAAQLEAYAEDPELVQAHGLLCYRFVRTSLRWSDAAQELLVLLGPGGGRRGSRRKLVARRVRRARHNATVVYRTEGAGALLRRSWSKLRGRGA